VAARAPDHQARQPDAGAGDDGDLVQGQILDLLAEVDLGGRADPECPVAEGDLVEIEGEDLVFGEVLLDAPGKEHFLDLAYKSLLVAQEEVAGHLLGNGTGALTRLAGDGPDGGGTDDADGVNARVLIEAGIFGGEYGIDHGLGNFVQPQGDATNFAKLGDQFPVPAVDLHGGSQFDIAQGADVVYHAAGGTGVGVLQAAAEANKLGIPVIGVCDSNSDPEGIDYLIPGNDDSSGAIRLYARGVADAILEGKSQGINEVVQQLAGDDEFVEVQNAA